MKKFDLRIAVSLVAATFFTSMFTHASNAVVGTSSVDQVRVLFDIAFIVVATFTGGYLLVMLYYLIRYKNSPNRDVSVWSIKKQNKYILAWVIIVIALVATETLVEAPVTDFVTSPPEGNQKVDGIINVVAHQFAFMINGSDTVTIQQGKLYLVNITSLDVIHSFFLYEFGYKLDAVPGRVNIFYLQINNIANEPTVPGHPDQYLGYQVICSEFCGPGHYTMAQDASQNGGAARIVVEASP